MSSGFGESTKSASSSSGNSSSNDAANFECNICFDLARDPVVTLCGHLFCWRCLYRWLHHRSRSQGCPVCKAVVEEETLVPLYGKGRSVTDSRMRSYLGMEIPPRPLGQRPPTVEEEEEEEDLAEEEEVVEEEEDPDVRTLLGRLEQRLESIDRRMDELRELVLLLLERIEQRFQSNNN